MLSNKQAYDQLEGAISTGWTFTPVEYPNVPQDYEQGELDFAKLSINIGKDKAMDIGASGSSNIFKRAHGILILRVYVRRGKGDSILEDYKDKFYALFDWVTINGISFTDKESVGPHDNTTDGDWRVLSCFVNFHFSRT